MRSITLTAFLLCCCNPTQVGAADKKHQAVPFPGVPEPSAEKKSTDEKPLTFQDKCSSLLLGTYQDVLAFNITPGLDEYFAIAGYDSVPDELVEALRDNISKNHEMALHSLVVIAGLVRQSCQDDQLNAMPRRFRLALGRNASRIRDALKQCFDDPSPKARFLAGATLLVLEPDNAPALEVVRSGLMLGGAKLRAECCDTIGLLRLSHGEIIEALEKSLRSSHGKVRRAAAAAVQEIGPAAKAVIPALMELLESEDAYGKWQDPFRVVHWDKVNVALFAMTKMGKEASPAVPALIRRLGKANREEQWLILKCFCNVGPIARAALPAVRKLFRADEKVQERHFISFPFALGVPASRRVRLDAAATLLCSNPGDKEATDCIIKAMTSKKSETRLAAAETIGWANFHDKALLFSLIDLL